MPKALKGSTFYSSSPFHSFPYTFFKFSCSQDIWRCFPWPAMTHSSASPSRPGVTTLLSELTVMPDCCGFLARLDIFGWLESGIRTRESATLSILYICSRFFCNISSVYSWSVYVFLLPLWFPIFLYFWLCGRRPPLCDLFQSEFFSIFIGPSFGISVLAKPRTATYAPLALFSLRSYSGSLHALLVQFYATF